MSTPFILINDKKKALDFRAVCLESGIAVQVWHESTTRAKRLYTRCTPQDLTALTQIYTEKHGAL